VDLGRPHLAPGPDPYSTLVYAAHGTDVRATIIDGEVLVNDHVLQHVDARAVTLNARREAAALASRAGF
jgi:5-methylthioadenosine/S-adenosylhomocysteine deaminase